MPVIEVRVPDRLSDLERDNLEAALDVAAAQSIPANAGKVTLHWQEADDTKGRTGKKRTRAFDPVNLVRDYLTALDQRDLDYAASFTAPEFTMQVPGAAPMHDLQSFAVWSWSRYKHVRKVQIEFDVLAQTDLVVVFAIGTLSGEWLDGTLFDGIRSIDRFEIRDGLLSRQEAWNDLAEKKAAL